MATQDAPSTPTRTTLIVGASSAIAQDLASRLAEEGQEILRWTRSGDLEGSVQVEDLLEGALPDLPETLHGLAYFPGTLNLTPFGRTTLETFRSDWEINVLGFVRVLQHALPALQNAPVATVAAVSTVAATKGLPFHASIAQSKAGLEGLIRTLAAEFAPDIRFNAVAPSLTDTPLAGKLTSDEKRREKMDERHPLGRVGEPADVGAAMAYLLGPDSNWVTGQVLGVDGGFGALGK